MDPKIYVKLIFDDESFTRSRLYFWVIGCLNEFLVSIEDNTKQWKLFREARVTPLLKPLPKSRDVPQNPDSSTPYHRSEIQRLQSLDQSAEGIRENLEILRSRFKNQLETVKALRDGLFNASALIESRAATKLGENVKLLTYVSIFYLPLAFCAALWAIPNINQGSTRDPLIVTAIIVGFATYVIVFNLENIAGLSGRIYHNWRANLVKVMQEDSSQEWKTLGQRFEEFRPNNDRKRPSEWRIVLYQMRMLMRKHKG
ncbi:hypothetical protein K469DRAFT_578976 [Zopfia rhizophila CBS 207.26]|uniref:Uncharacterized protein n=1 Tax=Zopfia rhizophila CBS 207.26 TaxID=1314779 RepID=A0A6A6E4B1_9PEZI|nr:hypothetical protein K469DRAFT_578976 [Zopfia rhizophila CBS 207.26]